MQVSTETNVKTLRLGEILLAEGMILKEDLEKAISMQASSQSRLGTILIRIGAVSEENLLQCLSKQLHVPLLTDHSLPELSGVFQFMSESSINFEWFLSNEVLLWSEGSGQLTCAARDVLKPMMHETLERYFPATDINYALIGTYAYEQASRFLVRESQMESLLQSSEDARQLKRLAEEAPVVELVNNVLSQAVDADASDIHIEPQESAFKIRFRIDGVLRDQLMQPIDRFAAVASRIKLVSGIDIAERRLPQDGRITARISGSDMDLRVSTLPGVFGESIVMRLLPKNREMLALDHLGMENDHLAMMKDWAASAGGIVLVTGPTGSGKSTTLHGALEATNDGVRKIVTVEDPVEIQIQNITQIQIHSEIGYSFARALRAILRQDPDVIMIGEIRDLETAEIAIQSALSGHLVLSTLHTNDAISSFTRLIDMGVEPFLVAAPLKGVQAQRLVRRLCPECSEEATPADETLQEISNLPDELLGDNWRQARGCDSCHGTGYSGRIGIYQMVPVDEKIQDMIVKGASINDIRQEAAVRGYRNLYQDGLIKASMGKTSINELLRLVASEETI